MFSLLLIKKNRNSFVTKKKRIEILIIELKLYMQRVEGVTMIVNWWMGYSVMDITHYKVEVNAKFTSNTLLGL